MLIHNITGMVYAARVTHLPTKIHFSLVVTLEGDDPQPLFRVKYIGPTEPLHGRLDQWNLVVVAGDLFAMKVAYDLERHQFDDMPTIWVEAPRRFFVRFDCIKPHPKFRPRDTFRAS